MAYLTNERIFSIVSFFLLAIVVIYLLNSDDNGSGCAYENYNPTQAGINKMYRENEIAKDRYKHQDVSQKNIIQQQKDYAQTYALPQKLADNYKKTFPDDLLPQEKETTDWAKANPAGKGSLELKSMLEAGSLIGVNTQGSSMKNSNYNLRSEVPNPIIPVSIFNNSSITPDIYRKEFIIGESIATR